jgi:hypothetical protein
MRRWENAPWMVHMMALKASHPVPALILHPPLVHKTQAKALVTKEGYHFVITTDIPANRTTRQFEGQV